MRHRLPALLVSAMLLVLIVAACTVGNLSAQSPELEFFESKIRPVLVEKCVMCHSAGLAQPMAGLRLDSKEGMLTGGASGVGRRSDRRSAAAPAAGCRGSS